MKNNSSIFVIVISLFIVIFIVISYFVLSDSLFKYSEPSVDTNIDVSSGGEVFHVRDNIYNYDDAKAICKAYNSRLASLNEVIDAYKKGANWCSYGWSEDQMALYPTQKDFWEKLQGSSNTEKQCGVPGVNGGFFHNKYYNFGANCYGNKPDISCNDEAEHNFERKKLSKIDYKASTYKHNIDGGKVKISPFNETRWHQ